MKPFRVRINCVDHYQNAPTAFDPPLEVYSRPDAQRDKNIVPVIRVFGATPTGQKVCVHVHGVFPYLYVAYRGPDDMSGATDYLDRMRAEINHCLATSYRRDVRKSHSFVAHIALVKGVPFYGYHVGYQVFVKISLLNPLYINRLAELLSNEGGLLGLSTQPHESHMQYIPQWMGDYNLFGCDYIDVARAKFRQPIPQYASLSDRRHEWHSRSVPAYLISDESALPRQSHSPVEVDICVQDILNRRSVEAREIHHDFIERSKTLWDDEKLVTSMAGLWRDEIKRRKARMGLTDSDSSPFPPEALVSVSADPRNEQPGWIHEEMFRDMIERAVNQERRDPHTRHITFENYVKPVAWHSSVKTAFESIENLHTVSDPELDAHLKEAEAIALAPEARTPGADEDSVFSYEDSFTRMCDEEDLCRRRERGSQTTDDDGGSDEDLGVAETVVASDSEEDTGPLSGGTPTEQPSSPVAGAADFVIPTGSAELRKRGIWPSGEYGPGAEADIEIDIPTEFRRVAGGRGTKREKTTAGSSEEDGTSRKRQKVIHNDPAPEKEKQQQLDPLLPRGVMNPSGSSDDADDAGYPSSQPAARCRKHGESSFGSSFPSPEQVAPDTTRKTRDAQEISKPSYEVSSDDQAGTLFPTPTMPTRAQEGTKSTPIQSGAVSDSVSSLSQNLDHLNILNVPKTLVLAATAPSPALIKADMQIGLIPAAVYCEPYYSREEDVPTRARAYGGKTFKLKGTDVRHLSDFDASDDMPGVSSTTQTVFDETRKTSSLRTWELEQPPPSRNEVEDWMGKAERKGPSTKESSQPSRKEAPSQIDGPTQRHRHSGALQPRKSTLAQRDNQYMSVMSIEIHVNTRGDLVPNPEKDEISCIFWCVQSEDERLDSEDFRSSVSSGVILLADLGDSAFKMSRERIEVDEESSELDLINKLVDIVRFHDPDILTGFEVHGSSWGYVIERARFKYSFDACDEFSRVKSQSHGRFGKEADRWGFRETSTVRITGRHVINIWRAMRGEIDLLQYTMENVAFHVLHRRTPHYSFADLTAWYKSNKPRDLATVINYYVERTQLDLEILERNELIPRTCEQARLLGVDFFSVFSRGSQFKVESLMFRIAKPESLIIISPTRKQVGQQNALECLPLVMEPQSAFYTSPVLVLDFQSLYPSIMIAYNYCYSTFVGRCEPWRDSNKMGFTEYAREPGFLELLQTHVNISPNGMMYVKPTIRKSLLAKMLCEILETRVMVKSGMKEDKDDKGLQRLLNNRQLALKLIANVTYGYTSASFSGRMPCSEIADSIVQTARETLERAIALIHSVKRWGAEVVYGDTDSLFIHLKGRTRDQAFEIGNEIAQTVTNINPKPVKLKFEKVYHPCVLLAKKRYVGFKYESPTQQEPEFDAKGIETVRRDGTPAEQKIEEAALKILFRTSDLSLVKEYFQAQCTKIMKGKVSIQDFCFAKEVRLGTYSDKGPPPPGALISTRKVMQDPRAEPQYGERVPYVVVTGAPGARLIDRCVPPDELLHKDWYSLDAEYYISKNLIPPLERIFNLVGASVRQWYSEMPKIKRLRRRPPRRTANGELPAKSKRTIEFYMTSSECRLCRGPLEPTKGKGKGKSTASGRKSDEDLCAHCRKQSRGSLLKIHKELNSAEHRARRLVSVCRSCSATGWGEEVKCDSKDCPVFYARLKYDSELQTKRADLLPLIESLEGGSLEW